MSFRQRFEFRKKFWFKIVSYLVLAILALPVAALLYLVFSPDYLVLIVRSESMEPTFDMGDVIVLRAYEGGEIENGQVIAFDIQGKTITHRAHSIENEAITTKGDAVQDVDQWEVHASQVRGTYSFKIPYLGYIANFFRSKGGALVLIVAASLLLISVVASGLFGSSRRRKGGDAKEETSHEMQRKRERESRETWV